MSELVIANRSDIVAIADAVRNKTNSTDSMTLSEIVNAINSISGEDGETVLEGSCTVTFPTYTVGETIYYLTPDYQMKTYIHREGSGVIQVLKGSTMIANNNVFGDDTYTCSGQPITLIRSPSSNVDAYAAIINGDVTFGYSDNAPT